MMLVAGIRSDLKVRRILRARLLEEDLEERSVSWTGSQQDLFEEAYGRKAETRGSREALNLVGHAPPVVRLALAFAAGVAWTEIGAPLGARCRSWDLLLLRPIGASPGPHHGAAGRSGCGPPRRSLSAHGGAPRRRVSVPRGAIGHLDRPLSSHPAPARRRSERSDGMRGRHGRPRRVRRSGGELRRVSRAWREGARDSWFLGSAWIPMATTRPTPRHGGRIGPVA
jgi:hypothetical protein